MIDNQHPPPATPASIAAHHARTPAPRTITSTCFMALDIAGNAA
jgi:hypothetical protein